MDKCILVIEDDHAVRRNIQSLLCEEGYTVFSAKDGYEGIKIAGKEHPDLIICDIMMKGLNGYDVLRELAKDESTRAIPFIFLTARVEREDIRRGMILGADDYLFKPFDADDLLNSISSRLKRVEVLRADSTPSGEQEEQKKYTIHDRIFIHVNDKPCLINISDIVLISAERQYSTLKMADQKTYLLRKPVSKWEAMLPEKEFLRIHRSTIINISYLVKMETWFNSSYLVYLKNVDVPFVISRRYSVKLRGKLLR